MSVINRDEALRAKDLAEGLMKKTDFITARKLVAKAQKMDPNLENISRMMMVCDVHCAASAKMFGNEMDWYGILQVEQTANDVTIKKQYKKLAFLLHPDKNKFPGAESAFKLIGEAQRILCDTNSRMQHDNKRKTCRKPVPAPAYKTQQVPNNRTQQANVSMRNSFNELKPENRFPQHKAQAQPAAFTHRPTFWTACAFCHSRYEYLRENIARAMTCRNCLKLFVAYEIPFQGVPQSKSSSQPTFPFPQPNKFPAQKACNEPHKRPDEPVPVFTRKAPVPSSAAENNNRKRKRKRKNMVESDESSDSESSSSESENTINDGSMPAQDLGSDGGQERRRSVRSKRQVSYNENVSDDDVDVVTENGNGSQKNIDTEREDEKQTHDHSTEPLPNGINPKEKMKEDKVESSAGAGGDAEEDLSSGSEENPITCDENDFNDFEMFRAKSKFQAGQIWALYDDEVLPRFYGLIKSVSVTTKKFSVKYVWLEAKEDETRKLPVSVGEYFLGEEEKTNQSNVFSHLMVESKKGIRPRRFNIFPRKGETWALFKNWNIDSDSPHEYEFVEILSDHAEGSAISVGLLSKVKGFSCVFCQMPKNGSDTCEIPPHEFCRFSHCVPSFRLKGTEGKGVVEGWYELDSAALPVTGSQNPSGGEAAPSRPAC